MPRLQSSTEQAHGGAYHTLGYQEYDDEKN